jgi:hypothetical protein
MRENAGSRWGSEVVIGKYRDHDAGSLIPGIIAIGKCGSGRRAF